MAFANGGYHSGGMRLVGERGPELEMTGPSMIQSNAALRRMLGGGGDKGMKTRMQKVEAQTKATARNMAKVRRMLERVTIDGDAMTVRVAT